MNSIIFLAILSFILLSNIICNPINNERNRLNAIPRIDFIENIRKEVSKSDSFEYLMTNKAYYGRHYCGRELIKALMIVCNTIDYYDNDSTEINHTNNNNSGTILSFFETFFCISG